MSAVSPPGRRGVQASAKQMSCRAGASHWRERLRAGRRFMAPIGLFSLQRLENVLFGPHDCSHAPSDGYPVIPANGNVEASGVWRGWEAGTCPVGSDHAAFCPSRACASAETGKPFPCRRRGRGPAGLQMPYRHRCHHIIQRESYSNVHEVMQTRRNGLGCMPSGLLPPLRLMPAVRRGTEADHKVVCLSRQGGP